MILNSDYKSSKKRGSMLSSALLMWGLSHSRMKWISKLNWSKIQSIDRTIRVQMEQQKQLSLNWHFRVSWLILNSNLKADLMKKWVIMMVWLISSKEKPMIWQSSSTIYKLGKPLTNIRPQLRFLKCNSWPQKWSKREADQATLLLKNTRVTLMPSEMLLPLTVQLGRSRRTMLLRLQLNQLHPQI